MASNGQTQDNYVGSSPTQNEDAVELLSFDHNGSDSLIQFPYLRPQISPSAKNLWGYQQNFPSGDVHDLNIGSSVDEHNRLTLNNPVDENVVMRDNIHMLDYQVSSCPSVGVGTVAPGFQTFTNFSGGPESFGSQILDSSIKNMRGGSPVFENSVGGTMTPFDCVGNPTVSGDDHYGLRAMTSGIGIIPITNVVEGQVNVHHYIPTPNTMLESGFKPNRIIDRNNHSDCSTSNLYMFSNAVRDDDGPSPFKKRRMQRTQFNSSALRSNHQIAAEPQQNSYLSTDFMLLPSGIDAGESDKQDKSGLAHGSVPANSAVQSLAHGSIPANSAVQSLAHGSVPANSAVQSLAHGSVPANSAVQSLAHGSVPANSAVQSLAHGSVPANSAVQSLAHGSVTASSGVQNQVADINIHNDEHPIHFDEWIETKLPVPAGSFDWYDDEVYQLIHPLLVKPITEDLKNLLDQMKADLEERFVKGSDES